MKNIGNVFLQMNQFKWKTNILRFCNLYETCIQAYPLLPESESPIDYIYSAYKPKTMKALVYQEIIKF